MKNSEIDVSTITVGLVQMACSPEADKNLTSAIESICAAAKKGAQIICLPELFLTQYFCQTEDTQNFSLAESLPGPTSETLSKLAKELEVVLIVPLFEKRIQGIYHNSAIVIDADGSVAGTYRKMHIPDDPGFYEKFYFTPGDMGFTPIETSVGKLGVLVCWDQWYPEAARLMAMAGADLLFYPTAIGWDLTDTEEERTRQHGAWETIQRSHAVANSVPVIVAHRTGFEASPVEGDPGIQFWGQSFVAGPQGEILAKAEAEGETTLTVELDMERTEQVKRIWPYFRDRRIDAYDELTKRWRD